MYTILIETANLMETLPYVGEDSKARYLGPGTQGVVYFTLYGKENQASQQVRIVSTGSDASKVSYGELATGVSVDVNGLPDRKPFQQGKTARLVLTTELLPPLGKLNKLVIGHTPTDAKLGWYLKQVIITDEEGQIFRFPCNQWLIADRAELSLPVEVTNGGGDSDNGDDTGSGGDGSHNGGNTGSGNGNDKPTSPKPTSLVLLVETASIQETPDYSYKDSKGKIRTKELGSGTTALVIFQIKGERGQSGEVYIRSGDDKSSLKYQEKRGQIQVEYKSDSEKKGQVQVEYKSDSEPFAQGKTARLVLPPDPSLDLGKLLTLSIKTDKDIDKVSDEKAWFLKKVTIITEANQQFSFPNKDKKWLFVPEQREIELSAEILA